ncbi:MAG: haloacid dehalogenase-like hydrolase [Alphaproteobacteria bacterium]|nr:haloacid dehalogenase-like hydrolase [Alphaproteobacteria bacterium]
MVKSLTRMAIAYDFDGTLAPGNMQEHQFLPDIKVTPEAFWNEVKSIAKQSQADQILVYMNEMIRRSSQAKAPVRKEDFLAKGRNIALFRGVDEWFSRITKYGKERKIQIEHYIISSGNDEIIKGTKIWRFFTGVYASKFLFDENGVAFWPALAVNYTTKTQYLFRINKGAHDLSDERSVNKFTPKENRPIPFENMIYIGDGSTDIPCFRLVRDQGGLSMAVFQPRTKKARQTANDYLTDGRVDCVVPAEYTDGSKIDRVVKARIDYVAARARLSDILKQRSR